MKKLLSILSICLVFISCSPDRVHFDELINKGNEQVPLMYFEGKPFTGVSFDIDSNGQLRYEGTFKDGEKNGLSQWWWENGQLNIKSTYKDGKKDGLYEGWDDNGQKHSEFYYKDGVIIK